MIVLQIKDKMQKRFLAVSGRPATVTIMCPLMADVKIYYQSVKGTLKND